MRMNSILKRRSGERRPSMRRIDQQIDANPEPNKNLEPTFAFLLPSTTPEKLTTKYTRIANPPPQKR